MVHWSLLCWRLLRSRIQWQCDEKIQVIHGASLCIGRRGEKIRKNAYRRLHKLTLGYGLESYQDSYFGDFQSLKKKVRESQVWGGNHGGYRPRRPAQRGVTRLRIKVDRIR